MLADNKCRLCGRSNAPAWFTAWDHEIRSCSQCGFMFAERLANASAPSYESDYHSEFILRDEQAGTLQRYDKLLKELEKITPGRRLFDAGCGAGGFLNFARNAGWSVSGIDGSQSAVRYAAEVFNLDVMVADLNRYELPPQSYDVISSFHVIEHLSNPLHLLRNIAVALLPDGIAYLGLPFYSRKRIRFHQMLYRIGIANYPFNFNLPDHISYFDARTLSQTLSSIGLESIRTWFTSKRTLGELAASARQSAGRRRVIGDMMQPFDSVLQKIGYYQHFNIIARKCSTRSS
jgi:SAM-dependent methyltransferase